MVFMASLFISVKMFGFISTNRTETEYKTWDQCVNALDIKYAKVRNKEKIEVIYVRDRGYLSIANKNDYTKQIHTCQTK